MTPPPTGRVPAWPDVLLWLETTDAIIRGLGHGLNNRALALGATIESLEPKRPVGPQLAAGLSREVERLSEQLRQMRTLPVALEREVMPLLLRDVLTAAIQLHRSHAVVGQIPVYLEGSVDAPPVLASESALIHATLVALTGLKQFAAPGGVVRVTYAGTAETATIQFVSQRDPMDDHEGADRVGVIRPTSLASALLHGAQVEIEQELTDDAVTMTWTLPSLRAMRRRAREAAALH